MPYVPFRGPRLHFADMLEAISLIEEFIGSMDLDAYAADRKTKAAVGESCRSSRKPLTACNRKTKFSARNLTGWLIAAWATFFVTATTG